MTKRTRPEGSPQETKSAMSIDCPEAAAALDAYLAEHPKVPKQLARKALREYLATEVQKVALTANIDQVVKAALFS